jgi:hypothetical protein
LRNCALKENWASLKEPEEKKGAEISSSELAEGLLKEGIIRKKPGFEKLDI